MNGKTKIVIAFTFLLLAALIAWRLPLPARQLILTGTNTAKNLPHPSSDVVTSSEYAVIGSTSTHGTTVLLTDSRDGFQVKYPEGWIKGKGLDDSMVVLEKYNAETHTQKSVISIGVGDKNMYLQRPEEKARHTTQVPIESVMATRRDIEYNDGSTFRTYSIPSPDNPNVFLIVSIYGDPADFHVLDEMVNSLKWIPR